MKLLIENALKCVIKQLLAMTNIRTLWVSCLAIGACIVCALPVPGVQAADFIPLGDLPGGEFVSGASDVSDDGTVVVGTSDGMISVEGDREAFRWTAETGMVGLGDFPGGFFRSRAYGVSSDGSVVVGYGAIEGPRIEAFRWTDADGMVGLGSIHTTITSSSANAVSADGKVVVGHSIAPGAPPGQGTNHTEAYRWTSGSGMVGLGDLPDHRLWSNAYGVSADGSVVVGSGNIGSENFQEAFRWTKAGGMVGLGDLAGGGFGSDAYDVSGDGSVVVGSSDIELGVEAFRWTESSGMVGLGDLPGGEFRSEATGVSGDGNVVVGNSQSGFGNEFFVWTEANGMHRLQDVLEANDTTGLSGWSGLSAGGISGNGQWVVGHGTNPSGFQEAFLVRLPEYLAAGFKINAGLNDAWYNPDTDGQGFFITVFPDLGLVSLAWFTYDTELPPIDATANLGDAGHRWLTAIGPIDGNQVMMNITMTSGGIFDTPTEIDKTNPPGSDGTLILTFDSCNSGTVEYEITPINKQGIVPIKRVADDNIVLCEALKMD